MTRFFNESVNHVIGAIHASDAVYVFVMRQRFVNMLTLWICKESPIARTKSGAPAFEPLTPQAAPLTRQKDRHALLKHSRFLPACKGTAMNCPFHTDDGEIVTVTPHALQSASDAIVYVCERGHVYERVDGHARLIHECQR